MQHKSNLRHADVESQVTLTPTDFVSLVSQYYRPELQARCIAEVGANASALFPSFHLLTAIVDYDQAMQVAALSWIVALTACRTGEVLISGNYDPNIDAILRKVRRAKRCETHFAVR